TQLAPVSMLGGTAGFHHEEKRGKSSTVPNDWKMHWRLRLVLRDDEHALLRLLAMVDNLPGQLKEGGLLTWRQAFQHAYLGTLHAGTSRLQQSHALLCQIDRFGAPIMWYGAPFDAMPLLQAIQHRGHGRGIQTDVLGKTSLVHA